MMASGNEYLSPSNRDRVRCGLCFSEVSVKRALPCGHMICKNSCLPTIGEKKSDHSVEALGGNLPENGDSFCLKCNEMESRNAYLRDPTADTMPRRPAPNPPKVSSTCTTALADALKNKTSGPCKKLSVRIFCKDSDCDCTHAKLLESSESGGSDRDQVYERPGNPLDDVNELFQQFRRRERNLLDTIKESQQKYMRKVQCLGKQIQETASSLRLKMDDEEDIILHQLAEMSSSGSSFYLNLFESYDALLVKEYEAENKLEEDAQVGPSFTAIRSIINDLNCHAGGIKKDCRAKEFRMEHRFTSSDNLLGSLQRQVNLLTFHASLTQESNVRDFCISLVWLNGEEFVAVIEKNGNDNNVKRVELQLFSFSEGKMSPKGDPTSLEKYQRNRERSICVCTKVCTDGESILLSIGRMIIRATFSQRRKPQLLATRSTKTVQALAWGHGFSEYFVLLTEPWRINLIDEFNGPTLITSLNSGWYSPFLHSSKKSFVVGNISRNTFCVHGKELGSTVREIPPPKGKLGHVWPVGVDFLEDEEEWFLLWKTVGGNSTNGGRWFITHHDASLKYRHLTLNGSLSDGDPKFFRLMGSKLAILYQCGKVRVYYTKKSNSSSYEG